VEPVELWLDGESITVEYQGEALSHYEVALQDQTGKLREVKSPQLFDTAQLSPHLRLFDLTDLWRLKALRANEYTPQRTRQTQVLQEALFPTPVPRRSSALRRWCDERDVGYSRARRNLPRDAARSLSDDRTARRSMKRGGLSMSENPGLPAKQAYKNARRHVPVPGQ
jgi:hypothetical protein